MKTAKAFEVRLPSPFGKPEESDGTRQHERNQCAAGDHGRGPLKPLRATDQNQHRDSERDAGLQHEGSADRRNVLVAVDIEIGMADPAEGHPSGNTDPGYSLSECHCNVRSFNARAFWPRI
jgi:hypothetical protein